MHMGPLGIGERLRNTREARGLSLDDVEASIRVRRRYLEALEAETFHDIPGPAYVKGFLRSYAAYLGLPVEELVAMYPSNRSDVAHGFPVEVRITPGNPYSRLRRIVTGIAVVFGIGVVLLGVMLYGQIRQFAVTSPGVQRAARPTTAPARPAPVQTTPAQTAPSTPPPTSQAPSHAATSSP
jgi:cytoskeleton protein RodZ